MLTRNCLLSLLITCFMAQAALAQLPLPLKKVAEKLEEDKDKQDGGIEGIIWEYKGTLEKAAAGDDKSATLEGKIRIEKSAIFDVSPTIQLPSKEEVKKVVDKVISGKGGDVKLPPAPQQKRLGEYRKLSGGKYRLDFNAKDSVNGIMIILKKRNTDDVLIGTFDERQGDKSIRKWNVELRPIED
jgi:hypothetical protein